MTLGQKIKKIRESKGLLQKQVAANLDIGYTNYNKMENGAREVSVSELQRLSILFNIGIEQILNFEGSIPQEVFIEDKSKMEQLNLIHQLDEENKTIVFKMIEIMLTKQKFKTFFEQNLAS